MWRLNVEKFNPCSINFPVHCRETALELNNKWCEYVNVRELIKKHSKLIEDKKKHLIKVMNKNCSMENFHRHFENNNRKRRAGV